MRDIRVDKPKLIKILRDNREAHKRAWDYAMADWKKVAGVALAAALEEVHNGTWKGTVHIPQPPSHLDDYDRAIRMLDLSIENDVVLSEREFAQLVQDEWEWWG